MEREKVIEALKGLGLEIIEVLDNENAGLTIEACKLALGKFGYKFEIREQEGYPLPLLFCTPKQ